MSHSSRRSQMEGPQYEEFQERAAKLARSDINNQIEAERAVIRRKAHKKLAESADAPMGPVGSKATASRGASKNKVKSSISEGDLDAILERLNEKGGTLSKSTEPNNEK